MDYLNVFKRIKTMADTGLHYADNEFDKERYAELLEISFQLMASIMDAPVEKLKNTQLPVLDYPTPQVDVRGFILNENDDILLVQEKSDKKWALPGGWADIGLSPSENVIKEVKEESGLEVEVIKLLAVYDKKCHPHPPQPHYVYKIMFLCNVVGGELKVSHDINDVNWFSVDDLPELSEDRNLKSQIRELYRLSKSDGNVVFD